jgi:hypothetical protein
LTGIGSVQEFEPGISFFAGYRFPDVASATKCGAGEPQTRCMYNETTAIGAPRRPIQAHWPLHATNKRQKMKKPSGKSARSRIA